MQTSSTQRLAPPTLLNLSGTKRNIIVIGASAGGIQALQRLFTALSSDLPAAVGVVLHRSERPDELASVLARRSSLPIIEPGESQPLRQGTIYLAPADHHMVFHARDVEVLRGPKEHHTRPAIDPLFRSAAVAYGARVVGTLLSGCGEDGVSGMMAIEKRGGLCLAQDPREAEMPSIPLNALRYDDVSAIFIIDDLAAALEALARGRTISRTIP
jgi:two-component system, chemotaxis family, protein-glutamate methylesterase/glutaminase